MSDPVSSRRNNPAPQRKWRSLTLAVMVTCALGAALLAYSLHEEARYALDKSVAADLGDLAKADLGAHEGRYVRGSVVVDAPKATFRRSLETNRYRLAPAGEGLFVVYGMPDGYAEQKFIPPRLVAGRLARASSLGVRFAGLSAHTGDGAWVIVDGDVPYGLTWLLGVEVLLLGFVLFNVVGIVRVIRPVR